MAYPISSCRGLPQGDPVLCEILEVLAAALRPWQQFCQPTLTMDLAPCHITQSVLQKARSLQLFIACVPTGPTPQLQVADVFCFRAFKVFFAGELQKCGPRVTKWPKPCFSRFFSKCLLGCRHVLGLKPFKPFVRLIMEISIFWPRTFKHLAWTRKCRTVCRRNPR